MEIDKKGFKLFQRHLGMKHDLFGTVQNHFNRIQGQLSDLFKSKTGGPESAKSRYFMKIDEYWTKTDYEMLINQSIAYLTLLKLFLHRPA